MQTLFSILFWCTSFVATLFSASTIVAWTKSSNVSSKEKGVFLGIALTLIGVTWGAYQLKQQGKLSSANLLLGGLWGLIIGATLWAMGKARWN